MARFLHLPPEIIIFILRHLKSQRQLAQACLVSRHLSPLAAYVLYRDVKLEGMEAEATMDGEDVSRPLRHFTRVVVSNPKLGSYVRKLSMRLVWELVGDYSVDRECAKSAETIRKGDEEKAARQAMALFKKYGMDGEKLEQIEEDMIAIAAAASSRGLPNGLIYHAGSRGLALVLFHHLPLLSDLALGAEEFNETIARSCLGLAGGGIPAGLANLETLTLTTDNEDVWFTPDMTVPFMCLPGLRTLSVKWLAESEGKTGILFERPKGMLEPIHITPSSKNATSEPKVFQASTGFVMLPGCSSITSFTFRSSYASPELLARLIALPARLEVFEFYTDGGDHELFTKGNLTFPRTLMAALRVQAAASLRRLVIDVDLDSASVRGFGARLAEAFGSLSCFEKLEHLNVPFEFLWEDKFPSTDGSVSPAIEIEPRISNPLDIRLPTSVKTLILHLSNLWTMTDFWNATGLPQSLIKTRNTLPSLRVLRVDAARTGWNVSFLNNPKAEKQARAKWQSQAGAVDFRVLLTYHERQEDEVTNADEGDDEDDDSAVSDAGSSDESSE